MITYSYWFDENILKRLGVWIKSSFNYYRVSYTKAEWKKLYYINVVEIITKSKLMIFNNIKVSFSKTSWIIYVKIVIHLWIYIIQRLRYKIFCLLHDQKNLRKKISIK